MEKSAKIGKFTYVEYSQELLQLNRVLTLAAAHGYAQDLIERLEEIPETETAERLGCIAAFCGIQVDGMLSPQEIDALAAQCIVVLVNIL